MPFIYSQLNLNQYSVGPPCRTICTVFGSPPCPDLNLIHYTLRQFFRRFLNHVGREFVQAVGVSQRAFAFEAGRAFEVQADDFGFLAQGRGVVGAG